MVFTDFTCVYSKKVQLHKEISDENIILTYGDYKKLLVIDRADIPMDANTRPYYFFSNIKSYPHTVVSENVGRFYFSGLDCIVYPYIQILTTEQMNNEQLSTIKQFNLFKNVNACKAANMIGKLRKDSNSGSSEYFMDYFVNDNIIQNVIDNKRDPRTALVRDLFCYKKKDEILADCGAQLSKIICAEPSPCVQGAQHVSVPGVLKDYVKLYNYQREDTIWMENLEELVSKGKNNIHLQYSQIIPILENSVIFQNIVFPKLFFNEKITSIDIHLKYYGGNLISEVGLGKTLSALYHAFRSGDATRGMYSHFVDFSTTCNYYFKRGKNRGQVCSKECTGMYCPQHSTTVFNDKRALTFKNLDAFNIRDFLTPQGLFRTNATLVVAPNQLCDQWVTEYYDKCVNDKRVVLLVTFDQFKNLTFADILFADLVVVSYNFLLNSAYNTIVQKSSSEIDITSANGILHSKDLKVLNLFHWRRVYLDEAHEIQNSPKSYRLLQLLNPQFLKADYHWNITGTPFANGLSGFLNLLLYNTNYKSYMNKNVHLDKLDKFCTMQVSTMMALGLDSNLITSFEQLFRRNTRRGMTVRGEFEGTLIKEYVKLLTFTTQERRIYDSYVAGNRTRNYDILSRLCCHSELFQHTGELIKNCKTLDEIQEVLLDYNGKHLALAREAVELREKKITILESQIQLYLNLDELTQEEEYALNSVRSKCASEKRTLLGNKKTYESYLRTYQYLKNATDQLQMDNTLTLECPICMDTIPDGQLTLTKCGHKFCWDCITRAHESGGKCPMCKTVMTNNDIFVVDTDSGASGNAALTMLEDIVKASKSTKIGNIIYFVRTCILDSDKVILFSQWDELLHKVGDVLVKHGIRLVYCQGSVYQRKRAIQSFTNNPEVKLIMLSSTHAASGINLTVANKIILLEPVYGTSEYRKDIETQAIGRADRIGQKRPIDVYRFIIKDTVEHDTVIVDET
ncbi:MAG: DEAD/DEAH box helicase [Proteobacteria bacterium]|nr:DEAD/DEAH box helicase [Pseudomonadota bacterium]NBP13234.1 DEAD/DEAH box helicase [bacterium]